LTLSKERENSLPSHLKGTARRTQANITGFAQGGGGATGATTSMGKTLDGTYNGIVTSIASGNVIFNSGGAGFVNIRDAGVQASGGTIISGTSLGAVKGSESGYGDVNFFGSSATSGNGNGVGGFSPLQSSSAAGSGSGTGTLNVTGSASLTTGIQEPYMTGYAVGGGTAKTAAGGSATASNMMASAGGIGSGMATGTAASELDTVSTYGVQIDSSAIGAFIGIGSGSYGNVPRQTLPYSNGFVNGNGGGSGTAAVSSKLTGYEVVYGAYYGGYYYGPGAYYGERTNSNANAAFKSIGGGSGFARGQNGGADGSASGGASGTAAGMMMSDPVTEKTIGDLSFSAMSAANGIGAFSGGFSIPGLPGPTGGTGSGNGAINIFANSSSGEVDTIGLASSSSSAGNFGAGEASGINIFGEAGGLGSGSNAANAISGIALNDAVAQVTAASTGTFDSTGSGIFFTQLPTFP
jgi:hypothetical protein